MTKSQIDQRIFDIIDLLVYLKIIPNVSACLDAIGMIRTSKVKVERGDQHFTVTHIANLCKEYGISADCVFGIKENVFTDPGRGEKLPVNDKPTNIITKSSKRIHSQ